jgi:cytochrome P450
MKGLDGHLPHLLISAFYDDFICKTKHKIVKFSVPIFRDPLIAVYDPALLAKLKGFTERTVLPPPSKTRNMGGPVEGMRGVLFFQTKDSWYTLRKFLQPMFSPKHIRNMTNTIHSQIENLERLWDNKLAAATTQEFIVVDAIEDIKRLTFDVVGLTSFGYAFETLSHEG